MHHHFLIWVEDEKSYLKTDTGVRILEIAYMQIYLPMFSQISLDFYPYKRQFSLANFGQKKVEIEMLTHFVKKILFI